MKEKDKEVEELKSKLDECVKEKEEYLNGWKRSRADFVNYKNEEAERIVRSVEYREEEIMSEIIMIADNFEDAKKEIPEDRIKKDEFITGFLRIKDRINDLIKKMGLEEIESLGKEFDPNFHEAVELIEASGESGTIIEETLKGYKRNDRVVRPSKVKVIK